MEWLCSKILKHLPLYRGATLWDELDKNVQELPTLKYFVNDIRKSYKTYVDLLN